MKKKNVLVLLFLVIIILLGWLILKHKRNEYSIDELVKNYNLHDAEIEDGYLNYLKKNIYPIKLRDFIENIYVPTSLLGGEDTGKETIILMKEVGYEFLFDSLFDKERINFDDCPVTDNFKNKFNTNLFNYFNIKESEDCKVDCSIEYKEQNLIVEVYGNFENTEPTYWKTYHFHYTLDSEGNVDDVIMNDKN